VLDSVVRQHIVQLAGVDFQIVLVTHIDGDRAFFRPSLDLRPESASLISMAAAR